MNVGCFSVQTAGSKSYISYNILDEQKLEEKTKIFRHIQFEKPIKVRMDGKKRISVITID
jgi:hypothetical protein